MMRQDAFFHADHVDLWELQALGAVQRHQRDGVAAELVFFVIVEIAAGQSHFVEEVAERGCLVVPGFEGGQCIDHFLNAVPSRLLFVGIIVVATQFGLDSERWSMQFMCADRPGGFTG